MTCDIEKCLEYRKSGGRFSVSDNLDVEYIIRSGCPILKELEDAYNKYCITQDQLRKDRDDPTIQEQSKKKQR